jgi:threonine aldolase
MSLINIYSDTQSTPTPAMRQAMAEAAVGDEQAGLDPTVDALCERTAALLGKERAVFLPSGTMCNAIAILVHCRAGDEIIAHESAHIINFEGGGPAALAGCLVRPLTGARGQFNADDLRAAVRPASRYHPASRMVVVEQTSNLGGGSVWPLTRIEEVAEAAREAGLILHMDGARLLNAAVASNVSAADYAKPFDSVWIDLSKGLGCPVGGVLAGDADFIEAAWQWKQRLGGAMRQAGIIAAAGIYALDNHVDRMAEDHANARAFADLVADHPALELTPDGVDTNIVFLDYSGPASAEEVAAKALANGLRIGATHATRFRAVTHIDLDESAVRRAADIFRATLDSFM